jgi:hypothetical protein
MSGLREPEEGNGASMTVKNSQAATIALLTAIKGVAMRSKEVRMSITDMRTMMMTPGLSIAPSMYLLVPYQNESPKVPNTPKNYNCQYAFDG